jgi:hypothetical protein
MESDWPEFDHRGPMVTPDDVRTFEKEICASLPDDFRSFLLDINGGQPVSLRRFRLGKHGSSINGLLSLNAPKNVRNLAARNELIRDDLPPELLLIGSDDGGARVCLCIRGEHRGEVWYMDTIDRRPEGSNPRVLWHDRRDMIQLADSFRAFMASLTPLE